MVGENTPAGGPNDNVHCDDTQLAGGGGTKPEIVQGPVIRMEDHVKTIQEALHLNDVDGMLGAGTSLEIANQWGDVNDPATLAMLLENGTITPEVADAIGAIQDKIGNGMFKQHDPADVVSSAECAIEGGGIAGLDDLLPEAPEEDIPLEHSEMPTHDSGGTGGTTYSYTPDSVTTTFYGKSEYGVVVEGIAGLHIEAEDGSAIPVIERDDGYYIETPAGEQQIEISRPDSAIDVGIDPSVLEGLQTLPHIIDPDATFDPMDGLQTLPHIIDPNDPVGEIEMIPLGVEADAFTGGDATFVGEPSMLERLASFADVQIDRFASLFEADDPSVSADNGLQMADRQVDNSFTLT